MEAAIDSKDEVIGNLSAEQLEKVEKVKEALKDLKIEEELLPYFKVDDVTVTRFLRGQKWDTAVTIPLIREASEFFRKERPDKITEESVINEVKKEKAFFFGRDKRGHPALVVKAARHFAKERDADELMKYIFMMYLEGVRRAEEVAGVHRFVVLYDRTGFTRANFDVDIGKKLAEASKYMPDRVEAIYVIKPNWLFHTLFAIVKPFMNADTVSKIVLTPWDPSTMLLQQFEPDQLLNEYGGTGVYQYKHTTVDGRKKIHEDDFKDIPLEEVFQKVHEEIEKCNLSPELKLEFYGLYQQATIGDNETTQPWAVQKEANAKWTAWTEKKGMEKAVAMGKYIQLFQEKMNH